MLDFWKERIGIGGTDRIGFWHDTETVEKHFAEMGAMAVLTQEETKTAFWEETAEVFPAEKVKGTFFAETEKVRESPLQEEEEKADHKRTVSRVFAAERFGTEKEEDAKERQLGKAFFGEMPGEEKEKRSIIPVTEEPAGVQEASTEKMLEMSEKNKTGKEETQEAPVIDIEKLMQQMTKRLWEERESCGRRLR